MGARHQDRGHHRQLNLCRPAFALPAAASGPALSTGPPNGGPATMQPSVQTHYQAELDAGRFCLQQCSQCRHHVFAPRELCPHCGAADLEWVPAGGGGTVYSTSTIARKADAGGPYNVALVDLDEGVRMMSRVEGVAPDAVAIGQRVRARVVAQGGRGLVVFTPDAAGGAA